MKNATKKRFIYLFLIFYLLLYSGSILVQAEEQKEVNMEELKEASQVNEYNELEKSQEMMDDLKLTEIEDTVDELLKGQDFSLSDTVTSLMNGEEVLTKDYAKEIIVNALLGQIQHQKAMIMQALLIVIVAAVFSNFSNAFENAQISEVSFYIVYMLLFAIIVQAFGTLSSNLKDSITSMVNFMQVLSPAYYVAIATATGITTATMYYEMILMVIVCVQWLMLVFVLPAVNIYVLLELVNHLSKEEFLTKLTELLKTLIDWSMKTIISAVIGFQVIRGLISPVIDSLKRTLIGKTASSIPGIGNAIDSVTEIVLGSAALVRNSLGVAALIILIICCIGPLIKYAFSSLIYKAIAAVAQPISDKRIVACLSTMGEGCGLLMKILFSTQVLFMVTLAIVLVTFH